MFFSNNGINMKIPLWHVGHLHLKPFINSHLNFLIVKIGILPSVTSMAQNQFLHVCCAHSCPSWAVPTGVICDKIFLNLLHYFLTFFSLLMPSLYSGISWGEF
jgi:hypothetical protein